MTQDFAKQRRPSGESKPAASRWTWFASGLFTGAFVTFLAGLFYLSPTQSTGTAGVEQPEPEVQAVPDEAEEMQWDFYEIFPKSEVPVVEEYTAEGRKLSTEQYAWILQVGSFQDPDDADELRASLLLLGLDATTASATVDGKEWHRVVAGPYDTELGRNRAQDRLAQSEIKAIPLRIPR